MANSSLDCVVIGYNETPFEEYEAFIRRYGEESEAYRDLKFSFVELEGKKLNYIGLLNHVLGIARGPQRDELKACDIPNLAAVYLTSYLLKRGFAARHVNLFQYEKEALAAYLAEEPLCVAITTTFYVLNQPVIEMVEFIRAHNPKVKIVVGGPLIANHARSHDAGRFQSALADIGADIYVIESQGESTLARILRCLKEGGDIGQVPNLAYIEGGRLKMTPKAPEANSLDEDYVNWRAFGDEYLGPTLQTRTARSCAFSCSFCNYPTRAGKLTLASLDTVGAELDAMRDFGYVKNVVFIDDTFNVPLPRFKDICRLMIERGYGFNWFSYFRCSNSDEEAIELLARSGCKGVFLGIESGSPTILKNMNKAASAEKYRKGMELLHRYGIITFVSLITGFPGETEETVRETIDFVRETRPDFYRSQLWYCEPGTPVDGQREKYGINGEGFVWEHNTMSSLEAMDYIDRMFIEVKESTWLPQWSFDFWTIPHLLGKGFSPDTFRELMACAHQLLSLEIAYVSPEKKATMQREHLSRMVEAVRGL